MRYEFHDPAPEGPRREESDKMRAKCTLAALAAALALAGCDRATMDKADHEGAEIGKKATQALSRTTEGLRDAGRKARDTLADATKPAPADEHHDAAPAQSRDTAPRDTGRQAREALGDAAITASIKTDFLKDPDLSVLKIDVDTRDGVVTLNGLAENDAARTRAEQIVGGIKGVRQVRNFLVVKRT
jgi:osmotically-inducible protein OsmY